MGFSNEIASPTNQIPAPVSTPSQVVPTVPTLPTLQQPALTTEIILVGWFLVLVFLERVVWPKIQQIAFNERRPYKYEVLVEQVLAEIVGRSEAIRAVLYEFHNGDVLASGRHFQKVSITNEYSAAGYSSIGHLVRAVPISTVSKELEQLEEEARTRVIEACSHEGTKHARMLYSCGVQRAVQIGVTGNADRYVGFVEVHFVDPINAEQINELIPLTNRIEQIVTRAGSFSIIKVLLKGLGVRTNV